MAQSQTAITELLNDFRVYSEGNDEFVGAKSVEIAGLSVKTAEVTGIGLAGSIDSPVTGHLEGIEVTITWRTPTEKALKLTGGAPCSLEIYGAIQHFDPANSQLSYQQLKITVKGRCKNFEGGTFEPMNTTDSSNTIEAHYLKYEIDSQEVLEIDKFNYIYKISGEDLFADIKTALDMK